MSVYDYFRSRKAGNAVEVPMTDIDGGDAGAAVSGVQAQILENLPAVRKLGGKRHSLKRADQTCDGYFSTAVA